MKPRLICILLLAHGLVALPAFGGTDYSEGGGGDGWYMYQSGFPEDFDSITSDTSSMERSTYTVPASFAAVSDSGEQLPMETREALLSTLVRCANALESRDISCPAARGMLSQLVTTGAAEGIPVDLDDDMPQDFGDGS